MRILLPFCLLLSGCVGSADPKIFFGKTVFIGDSITYFWNLSDSFPGQDFINMGISGQASGTIRGRFNNDVVALHPSTVVILAGTNDIFGRASLTDALANIEAMAMDAQEHRIFPIVCTLPPVDADITHLNPLAVGNYNPAIQEFNQMLKSSPRLNVLCDYHKALADPVTQLPLPGVLRDGVHPSLAGYALLTKVIDDLQ